MLPRVGLSCRMKDQTRTFRLMTAFFFESEAGARLQKHDMCRHRIGTPCRFGCDHR